MGLPATLSITLGEETLYIPGKSLTTGTTWNTQRHNNAQWEFHFIQTGKCQVDVEQQQYLLCAGQALLVRPGLYHQAKTLTREFRRFTLGFLLPSGKISQALTQALADCPVFTPDPETVYTIDRIMAELDTPGTYNATYLTALVNCLTVELLRFWKIGSPIPRKQPAESDFMLTQQIDTYFEQHLADSAGENQLAAQLHVSRRQLIRILKKHYAMTFRQKLLCARMDYATFLLRTTNYPISRIGADVGYSSESAFFKVFRRYFSLTPRQYRAQYKSQ